MFSLPKRGISFLPLLLILSLWVSCRQEAEPRDVKEAEGPIIMSEAFPDLFPVVQNARIFEDSKTFVDCIPTQRPEDISHQYQEQKDKENFDLEDFVSRYFELPPQLTSDFVADTSLSPAAHVNRLWPVLTRQPDSQRLNTKVPLPKPYIAPGGRFREIYYWDSYFTMLGLAVSDSSRYLIRSMVENFTYLIEEMGFIPNGNRTYFRGRSQPPFFSLMVGLLSEIEGEKVLEEFLPAMEKEYDFWMDGKEKVGKENPAHKRVVLVQDQVLMNRYWDDVGGPRPESYAEDVQLADTSEREADDLYLDLRAACESGWDFSSRWLRNPDNLASIHTTEIVPVDLNSLIYHLETLLAKTYELVGNDEKKTFMQGMAASRKAAILTFNWDEKSQTFQDFDFVEASPTQRLSLAMMYPLFLNIATQKQAEKVGERLGRDFLKAGGVVTTLKSSGQQWDAPNGWAPLQWVSIAGLRNYEMEELADEIKKRWVNLNVRVYKASGKMVEKYNVLDMGLEAGGGEYPLQDGFGWTNGVLLKLLSE